MLYLNTLTALTGFAASAAAGVVPRQFAQTDANGFPKPNEQQTLAIAEEAGGKLPGGSLPSGLSATSITTLQLIAFNELFEVAYFSNLLYNLTSSQTGYDPPSKDAIIQVIKAIRAVSYSHKACIRFVPRRYYGYETDNIYSKNKTTLLVPSQSSRPTTPSPLLAANTPSPLPTSPTPSISLRPSLPSFSAPFKEPNSTSQRTRQPSPLYPSSVPSSDRKESRTARTANIFSAFHLSRLS